MMIRLKKKKKKFQEKEKRKTQLEKRTKARHGESRACSLCHTPQAFDSEGCDTFIDRRATSASGGHAALVAHLF